ncbi:hypothetical protein KY290_013483 [Solanum tuberosum]|uniref:Reverse transcriptase domain-containing protein n=1 Tax=Solanum tuberosum TaxID=4113 RepID=A0ABQ7VPL8_SOLTU|nr:hypothetical protein KY289_013604 [Solanum tuberosum]KAH0769502.1 hypothetical protein KY290_013483 [Solanum tuberosum]
MGFDAAVTDKVWRLLANNWYSILINGQAQDFFHSTRGVKQGDPLSPALFVLTVEVLSRAFNSLFLVPDFKGFGMPKWSDQINHLAYANDTIIFVSANKKSVEMVMTTLHKYELQSGQLVNKQKSEFFMHGNFENALVDEVRTVTGLVKKIHNKLRAWKGKMLSFGDKVFWSTKEVRRSKHWVAWFEICKPKEEGGLGFRGGSQTWKHMLEARDMFDQEIWWELRQLFTEGRWNEELISNTFNEEICDHIKGLGQPRVEEEEWDKAWWMLNDNGKFSVRSAWEKRLPIGEVLINNRIANSVECWCCNQGVQESIEHIFMKCPASESLWKDFAAAAGLFGPFLQLRDTFNKWKTTDVVPKLKPLYKIVPMFIVWQIWRRRNVIAHGDKMSKRSMKMGINRDLYFMEKSLYPWLINLPTSWAELVFKLNQYSPKIGCKVVYWKPPSEGTFKCNTDGACKGNPSPSSGAYCVRDAAERFIYTKTKRLGYRTNLIEEIKAFR